MTTQKSQKRQLWVILTLVFLGFIGVSMPYLIFPALFLNPNYSTLAGELSASSRALLLGITLAAYPLGQFVGSPILGALSDDLGRKPLLTGSLILSGICNLLTGLAIISGHLTLLIGSRFVAGLMEGNIAIARAMAADMKTLSKHKTFGKINAVTSIAYLIGPLMGGVMTDKSLFKGLTMATPFFFVCFLFFCLAGLSALMLKKFPKTLQVEKKTFWQRVNFIKRIAVLFSHKPLKILIMTSTLFTLAVDVFYEFAPVYLTVKWTLVPAQLVLYNGVLCLALALGNGWLPTFVSSRASNRNPILWSLGGLSLFLIGIVLTSSAFLMVLWFALSGLVIGIASTLVTVKISDAVSDAIQGEVMGVQVSLRFLGDGIICLFGGALLIVSPKIILIGAALMSLIAMLYYRAKQQAIKTHHSSLKEDI